MDLEKVNLDMLGTCKKVSSNAIGEMSCALQLFNIFPVIVYIIFPLMSHLVKLSHLNIFLFSFQDCRLE